MGLRSRAWVAPVRAPARLSRSARMLGDSRSSGRRCGNNNNNNNTCIILCCLVTLLCQVMIVARGHGDHGSMGPVCMRNIGVKLQASYLPGIITVDGDADDWSVVDGHSFMLLQAITDDAAQPYPEGDHSMQIKVRSSPLSLCAFALKKIILRVFLLGFSSGANEILLQNIAIKLWILPRKQNFRGFFLGTLAISLLFWRSVPQLIEEFNHFYKLRGV